MRIAYLVNQYPKISHSFIRREIEGVEKAGHLVLRYSIRFVAEPLVDPRDKAEVGRTTVVLARGAAGLALELAWAVVTRPIRLMLATGLALQLGRRSSRGLAFQFAYLGEACVLRRMLAEEHIDHVHAHFGTNSTSVALLCQALGGPPYSFTFHGPEFFEFPSHANLGLKIARARFSVAISLHGRSQLQRVSDREHWRRIAHVRCGVDRSFLDQNPTPIPTAPRLVCVARIDSAKGHLVLVKAAEQLAREGRAFEISLVGDGDLRPTVEAAIHAAGLEKHFHFLGWRSGAQVLIELHAARALVLPSFEEGLPVVFMEALALERPVISTYIAGIPELVRPGLTGWLVPAGSVEELTVALREVLDATPEFLQAMGQRGAALVRERHDSDREALAMAALFEGAAIEAGEGVVQINRRSDTPERSSAHAGLSPTR